MKSSRWFPASGYLESMEDSEYSKRWSDPKFLSRMGKVFTSIFVSRTPVEGADLRGLIVGLDGAPSALLAADFQDVNLENVDLSYSSLSCAFSRACIQESKFCKAVFDTCRLKGARFRSCVFVSARFDGPTLDDSVFLDCSFTQANLVGRGLNEYGGRRVVFERCDFKKSLLENLQLRACVFRDCSFETTTFRKCLMVGVKFEGTMPAENSFVSCHR
jgi:uncharacterized protein YjbI with pentapeptide repeats